MAATPLGRHFPIPGFAATGSAQPSSHGYPVLSAGTMSLLPAGSPSTEVVTMSNRSFEGLDATLGGMHLRPPTVVSAADTLEDVASAMVRDGVSCAILEEQPLRVVTEFDLARGLAQGLGPGDQIAPIASAHPSWAPPSASVAEAAALMVSLGIRHLVVLDISDRPSGLVSMAELFDVLVRSQEPMALYAKFADIMLHGGSEASNQVQQEAPPPQA
jgi:CBS domain-containing protein